MTWTVGGELVVLCGMERGPSPPTWMELNSWEFAPEF